VESRAVQLEVTAASGDVAEVKALRALVQRAERGDVKALSELRTRLDAVPAAWEPFGDVAAHAQRAWVKLAAGSNPVVDEAIRKTTERLRAELLGASPSPLERLLVERIVACHLQVQHTDLMAAHFEQTGGAFRQGEYWQRMQDRAHWRHLSAIGTLAQVRRLFTPAVQVNIAENQVNVAG
jgi:hypothetical protein